MVACANVDWEIELILDKDGTNEFIGFRGVQINSGIITGKVFDEPREEMSDLRGTCTPSTVPGGPDMSHMTFVFNVTDKRGSTVKIIMIGTAVELPNGMQQFRGGFRAVALFSGEPALVSGRLETLAIDPGDTGTGNGNQT